MAFKPGGLQAYKLSHLEPAKVEFKSHAHLSETTEHVDADRTHSNAENNESGSLIVTTCEDSRPLGNVDLDAIKDHKILELPAIQDPDSLGNDLQRLAIVATPHPGFKLPNGKFRKITVAQLHTRLQKVVRQPVVRRAAVALNFRQTTKYKREDLDLAWFAGVKDVAPSFFVHKVAAYPHRMVNRFPRVREALAKSNFSRLMEAFYQVSNQPRFAPVTFIERLPLPCELEGLEPDSVMILKPNLARGGTGIHLQPLSRLTTQEAVAKQVVQTYLTDPLLLNGYKFDLRLYVLVTSLQPLTAFLYQDGLVRVCTQAYQSPHVDNLTNLQMHLTNYAVNKGSAAFKSTYSAGFSPEEDAVREANADNTRVDAEKPHHGRKGVAAMVDMKDRSGQRSDAAIRMSDANRQAHAATTSLTSLQSETIARARDATKTESPSNPSASTSASITVHPDDCSDGDPAALLDDEDQTPDNKQNLLSLWPQLAAQGCNVEQIKADINTCVSQALVAMAPMLLANTRHVLGDGMNAVDGKSRCFQVLGFDLMLDAKSKPWIIEVNTNPSLLCGTAVDWVIKEPLVHATLGWAQRRLAPMVEHVLANTQAAVPPPTAIVTSPPRPRGRPQAKPAGPEPLGTEWHGPPMDDMNDSLGVPDGFLSLADSLERIQDCFPFDGPEMMELYLRCCMRATSQEFAELGSKAVVPIDVLYAAVAEVWESIIALVAQDNRTVLPSLQRLWPCEWSCFNMALFCMATTALTHYACTGQAVPHLCAVMAHSAISEQCRSMVGVLKQELDPALFMSERARRNITSAEVSDEI
eukprot:TRINITY_DN11186_c0_g1_i4.p1 TRINITY_DN11186_c0_g1~~TRINITY_DN11186_c0_g1_i4.p1  ORF type:complete len:829 (+),score=182.05 TRINITY_DN11186_c0_g1_i4:65-2488(+)